MQTVSPIRIARTKKGLTQSDLGKRVGVTKAAVSKWENGNAYPEVRILGRLVRALKPHLNLDAYVGHVDAAERGKADSAQQARAA